VPTKPPGRIKIATNATGFYGSAAPAPSIASRTPDAGAVDVATSVLPAVQFDRIVSGVTSSSFILRGSDGTVVPATITVAGDALHFTMHPSTALTSAKTYTLSLTSAITSVEGASLAPTSWVFTVAAAPPPPPGATAYDPPRTLTFVAGSHTGYRFDAAGNVTGSKSATLLKSSSAPTNLRTTSIALHPGAWFQVTAGIWAGYWVRESPSVYLPGISAMTTYSPARLVGFAAGTYTGYRFDGTGHVTASKTATLASSSGASADKRAIINGRAYLGIVNGIWAGYWVAESSSVFLR
jgi:hypothetical protein